LYRSSVVDPDLVDTQLIGPPGNGSGSLLFTKDSKKFQKVFLKYLMIFDNIIFNDQTNAQAGSGSCWIRNKLASRIRIRISGFQIRGSGSKINVYGSITLMRTNAF
jgi:hypothetical protein